MPKSAHISVPDTDPTTANLYFREKGKVQPVGYEGLGIDEEVTVILKGKVSSLGTSSWEKGKRVELTLNSCEISSTAKPAGLDTAIREADKTRKKV